MVDFYIIVGAGGVVGAKVKARLESRGQCVVTLKAKQLLNVSDIEIRQIVTAALQAGSSSDPKTLKIGLILAHRVRVEGIHEALRDELRVTRDLVRMVAMQCMQLHVVVLGSVTGSFVDRDSAEAYHYAKDLQKSCVRYSVSCENIHMNLLELSWFEKYSVTEAADEYMRTISRIKDDVGHQNLITANDIADFSIQLIESSRPPRGQIITLDGGYSLMQR